MGWTSIFSGGVDKIVDSVADGLDELFTSDDERLKAKNLLEQIKSKAKLEADSINMEFEKEITKRWTSDNEHWVTRMVRPLSYTFMMVLFGALAVTDGNIGEFKVNSSYVPVIETLLVTMTLAYFGSRGLEKWKKIK